MFFYIRKYRRKGCNIQTKFVLSLLPVRSGNSILLNVTQQTLLVGGVVT
jgi:hypothetical protein